MKKYIGFVALLALVLSCSKEENAIELANLIKGMNAYVNLIPYNEVLEKPFKRSLQSDMKVFFDVLKKRKLFMMVLNILVQCLVWLFLQRPKMMKIRCQML